MFFVEALNPPTKMLKTIVVLLLTCSGGLCQPLYTRMRADAGVEVFGIAPQGSAYAEALFGYQSRSFWAVQTGLGLIGEQDFLTYSFSGALTYAHLLNPYRRSQCNPSPGFNRFEVYLEGGLASFFSDSKYNKDILYVLKNGKDAVFTPLALAGMRFHFVTGKFIYVLKIRFTPALVDSRYASVAGLTLGMGWR